jgi:hypothetical protein
VNQQYFDRYIDIAYLDIDAQEKGILYAILFLGTIRGVGSFTYKDLFQYVGIPEECSSAFGRVLQGLLDKRLIERVPHSINWRSELIGLPTAPPPRCYFEFKLTSAPMHPNNYEQPNPHALATNNCLPNRQYSIQASRPPEWPISRRRSSRSHDQG